MVTGFCLCWSFGHIVYIYICNVYVCVYIYVCIIYIYIDLAFRCFCDFQTIYALTAGRTFGSPAKVREDFVSVHSSGSHERMIRTWNGNDGNVPLFKKFKTPIIVLITINTFTYPSGLGYISYLSTKLANCGAPRWILIKEVVPWSQFGFVQR